MSWATMVQSMKGPVIGLMPLERLFDGLSVIESATNGKISVFKETMTRLLASYIYKTHIGGNYLSPLPMLTRCSGLMV
jgi:hypothetical protein